MCATIDWTDPYPDGLQTIADAWVIFVHVFDTPGRAVVRAILAKPKLATLFHVD